MTPRGTCPVCSYRVQLRQDGTVGKHRDPRISNAYVQCGGEGQPSKWAEHNRQAMARARGDSDG